MKPYNQCLKMCILFIAVGQPSIAKIKHKSCFSEIVLNIMHSYNIISIFSQQLVCVTMIDK